MITSTDPIIIVASNRYDHQRSTQIEKERFILFRLIIGITVGVKSKGKIAQRDILFR